MKDEADQATLCGVTWTPFHVRLNRPTGLDHAVWWEILMNWLNIGDYCGGAVNNTSFIISVGKQVPAHYQCPAPGRNSTALPCSSGITNCPATVPHAGWAAGVESGTAPSPQTPQSVIPGSYTVKQQPGLSSSLLPSCPCPGWSLYNLTTSLLIPAWQSVATGINSPRPSVLTTNHYSSQQHHLNLLLRGNCQEFRSRVTANNIKKEGWKGERGIPWSGGRFLPWFGGVQHLVCTLELQESRAEDRGARLSLPEQLSWSWMWRKAAREQKGGQKAATPHFYRF